MATKQRPSGRERQILDLLYTRGASTVAEVHEGIPDPPSYSAVRATLRIMEQKGFVRHREDGLRYVYLPVERKERALSTALRRMAQTFFEGKPADALAALLDENAARLSQEELDRLAMLIERARKAGQ